MRLEKSKMALIVAVDRVTGVVYGTALKIDCEQLETVNGNASRRGGLRVVLSCARQKLRRTREIPDLKQVCVEDSTKATVHGDTQDHKK
jgi:hypothetical protein